MLVLNKCLMWVSQQFFVEDCTGWLQRKVHLVFVYFLSAAVPWITWPLCPLFSTISGFKLERHKGTAVTGPQSFLSGILRFI